jgi:hypothetical protein
MLRIELTQDLMHARQVLYHLRCTRLHPSLRNKFFKELEQSFVGIGQFMTVQFE